MLVGLARGSTHPTLLAASERPAEHEHDEHVIDGIVCHQHDGSQESPQAAGYGCTKRECAAPAFGIFDIRLLVLETAPEQDSGCDRDVYETDPAEQDPGRIDVPQQARRDRRIDHIDEQDPRGSRTGDVSARLGWPGRGRRAGRSAVPSRSMTALGTDLL